jgi:fibronectin type 3 domain-containing protein
VISQIPLIESAGSNEVCLEMRDFIPPGPPAGLTVLSGAPGELVVTWSPNQEPDLAVYRLYRSEEGSRPQRIAEISKPATTYTDTTAKPGVSYRYTLTAVDTSGNESTPSIPADGKLP